jgi:hypothetical protein
MSTSAPLPLDFPLLSLILLIELLFGIGFNQLVDWAHQHNLWHVSVSVIFGVAGTLVIPSVALLHLEIQFWQASIIFGVCFVASGIPMIVGGTRRTVKENHHRRPLPNSAMRVRDEVVMEIKAILDKIVNGGVEVVKVVHDLHEIVGKLKSM